MLDDFRSPETKPKEEFFTSGYRKPTEIPAIEPDTGAILPDPNAPVPRKQHPFWRLKWTLSKRQTIVVLVVALLLIAAAGVYAYRGWQKPAVKGGAFTSKKPTFTPKVNTIASNLTGLQVDPSINNRPLTGVMVENSEDARPQSGLDQAGIVFEAIAEGGITRFLALFQDSQPDYLGPVRSVRPYYLQWCMGFDCALAHAGGSPEALADIRAWGGKDLDQFANGGSYKRISSRYAPHNLYTSIASLTQLESAKGFGTAKYTSLIRKKDTPSKAPTAASIDVAISSPAFNSHYDYDAKTDTYLRSQAGAPHMVVDGGGAQRQITPKVIVALFMQYGLEADDHHSQYNVIGSGQGVAFQDGTATPINWSKADTKAALTLTGSDGKPFALNAGQTWFVALSAANLLTYK